MSKAEQNIKIGITMFRGREETRRYSKVQENYIESVYKAGGLPILIPTLPTDADPSRYLQELDGIIFTGGEDISPLVYGEEPIKELGHTDINRDKWEISLYRAALDMKKVVLGICRGIQLMNVAEGGTVYQDIYVQHKGAFGHLPRTQAMESYHHHINVDTDSLLYRIYGQEKMVVNSFHHQAIKNLAAPFSVTARSADGIIEGVEREDKDFVLGVQFHAEALPPLDSSYLAIFEALTAAARKQ